MRRAAQVSAELARGYLSADDHVGALIPDPGFRRAITELYFKRERAYVAAAGEELTGVSPYRKSMAEEEA